MNVEKWLIKCFDLIHSKALKNIRRHHEEVAARGLIRSSIALEGTVITYYNTFKEEIFVLLQELAKSTDIKEEQWETIKTNCYKYIEKIAETLFDNFQHLIFDKEIDVKNIAHRSSSKGELLNYLEIYIEIEKQKSRDKLWEKRKKLARDVFLMILSALVGGYLSTFVFRK